ncbi:MAG: Na+/H+ antiporter NhaC [Cytophagales bacterium]|jgi:NhaC family Na+:H+ antiporter|nr:Na+/H+ antiporter NhaC [Cytophagales bacterium]MCA6378749.1 Na+/H+ antiporter NhaC [Cytophagales bacterium]MCA6387792.1 Na+/H+ antiporter NhaC [Cytophagales bacterium]MCA6390547.1 Na+/H+ antiporter NhaC [Cytophagales bacterium]MCA6401937.1 Na+/H+ antiporter NhaC [Cytophagales bacterium]
MTEPKRPTLIHAFIPIFILVILLAINVIVFGSGATDGPNQIALVLAASVAGIVSWRLGHSWEEIEISIVKSISSAMGAMLILLVIGSLSGAWLLSGIVPAMIYYGLKIMNPTFFLFAACIVCAIVSLATGSSWSTIATVGIALLGIGKTLGIHEGVIAGALISGAYFGDKMSPLSDTTNLAPAMAGTDLFTHIRYMVITTVPTLTITLIIFFVWGFTLDTAGVVNTDAVLTSIDNAFNLNPILFLVPALVLFMIVRKVPAIPALLVGSILGGIFAIIFQPQIIAQVSGINGDPVKSSFVAVMKSLALSINIQTDNAMISELLSSGGMAGMLNTIWLILGAMIFGGVMESCGLLKRIVEEIIKWAHSTGSLVASTAVTSIFFNLTAGDQYMAIAVPGRMFADTYRKRGYNPELLSRTLEDAGTVTSVLVPWNTCGATQSKVLGISTWTYAPYCFFCIISPMMTVLMAYLNYKIRRLDDAPTE